MLDNLFYAVIYRLLSPNLLYYLRFWGGFLVNVGLFANMGFIETAVYYAIKDLRSKSCYTANDDSEVIYLTEEHMNKLLKFYDEDTEIRRKEYIEMFLFSFHCCGLRVVDLMTLQWSHIDWEKKEVNKVQVKTKNRNIIPLNDDAITILRKWQIKRGKNNQQSRFL